MEIKSIVPLMNRVLVQRLSLPSITPGGIFIPRKGDEASKIGRVIAVGKGIPLANGTLLRPIVKKGDFVLVNDWSGLKVPTKQKRKQTSSQYYLYKEDDLLGIVRRYKH